MPFFDVLCADHGQSEIFSHTPADLRCPLCEKPAQRVWSSPPTAVIEFRDGFDMGAGEHFSTKRDRDNWLAANGKRKVRT